MLKFGSNEVTVLVYIGWSLTLVLVGLSSLHCNVLRQLIDKTFENYFHEQWQIVAYQNKDDFLSDLLLVDFCEKKIFTIENVNEKIRTV